MTKGTAEELGDCSILSLYSTAQIKLKCICGGCDELHPAVHSKSWRERNASNRYEQMLLEHVKIEGPQPAKTNTEIPLPTSVLYDKIVIF